MVLFGLSLFAVSILTWLKIGDTHGKFATITPIVQSWCGMLAVLGGAFFLTLYFHHPIALMGVAGGIFAKGVHEIFNLYRPATTAYGTPKNTPFFWLDAVLLGCLTLFFACWVDLSGMLTAKNQLGILLFVIFAVQFNDVGQYVMGKWLGHQFFARKLAPAISPNKTIEGAIFGTLLTATLCLPIGQFLTPFSWMGCFGLAVLLGGAGIVGDLLQSAVKRRHGVKDMGTWLKGHGGIMDRVDSLLVSLPLFWVLFHLFIL